MNRGTKDQGTRLKTGRGRTASSSRWLQRQLNDPYVKQARADGYRSRAAFKLAELDDRFHLLKQANRVVDLGVAPGGWSQVVPGVTLFEMDFMADEAPAALIEALGGAPDLVLSDMAANTVGHKQTDHLRTMGLVETAADFAIATLAPGGAFVAKVLAGGTDTDLLALLKKHFTAVKHAKPPASRKDSSEWYVVATGFKARIAVLENAEDSED
jgi:23S rRNA (uridine2552-2'-O)-methyltransferase